MPCQAHLRSQEYPGSRAVGSGNSGRHLESMSSTRSRAGKSEKSAACGEDPSRSRGPRILIFCTAMVPTQSILPGRHVRCSPSAADDLFVRPGELSGQSTFPKARQVTKALGLLWRRS